MVDADALIDYMRSSFLDGGLDGDRLADDVVIEWPFAAAGRPRRVDGREQFLAMAGPARAALPFRLDEFEVSAVHETTDPDVVVVEYRLGGVIGGDRRSAAFVAVIRQRDGLIAGWREYQDTFAMIQAMAGS